MNIMIGYAYRTIVHLNWFDCCSWIHSKIAMHYILVAEKGPQSIEWNGKKVDTMRWGDFYWAIIEFTFSFVLHYVGFDGLEPVPQLHYGNAAMNVEAQEMRLIVFKLKYRTTRAHTHKVLIVFSFIEYWIDWITVKMINELMAY